MPFTKMRLVHRIESDFDLESEKIVYDLAYPGCARRFHWAARPEKQGITVNVNNDSMATDGAVAVAEVGSCQLLIPATPGSERQPNRSNFFKRYARKQLLVVRHDIIRSNLIYAGFDRGANLEFTDVLAESGARGYKTA